MLFKIFFGLKSKYDFDFTRNKDIIKSFARQCPTSPFFFWYKHIKKYQIVYVKCCSKICVRKRGETFGLTRLERKQGRIKLGKIAKKVEVVKKYTITLNVFFYERPLIIVKGNWEFKWCWLQTYNSVLGE